jgi:hypothetical protein
MALWLGNALIATHAGIGKLASVVMASTLIA